MDRCVECGRRLRCDTSRSARMCVECRACLPELRCVGCRVQLVAPDSRRAFRCQECLEFEARKKAVRQAVYGNAAGVPTCSLSAAESRGATVGGC